MGAQDPRTGAFLCFLPCVLASSWIGSELTRLETDPVLWAVEVASVGLTGCVKTPRPVIVFQPVDITAKNFKCPLKDQTSAEVNSFNIELIGKH